MGRFDNKRYASFLEFCNLIFQLNNFWYKSKPETIITANQLKLDNFQLFQLWKSYEQIKYSFFTIKDKMAS